MKKYLILASIVLCACGKTQVPIVVTPSPSFSVTSEAVVIANQTFTFSGDQDASSISVTGSTGPSDIIAAGKRPEVISFAHSTTADVDFSGLNASKIILNKTQTKSLVFAKFSTFTRFLFISDVMDTLSMSADLAGRGIILINTKGLCDSWNFEAYSVGAINEDRLQSLTARKEMVVPKDENNFSLGIIAIMKCDQTPVAFN